MCLFNGKHTTMASRKREKVLKESRREEIFCPSHLPLRWTNMNQILISSVNLTEPYSLVKHMTKTTSYLIWYSSTHSTDLPSHPLHHGIYLKQECYSWSPPIFNISSNVAIAISNILFDCTDILLKFYQHLQNSQISLCRFLSTVLLKKYLDK